MVLGGGKGEAAVSGARPINHADVLVRVSDAMNVQEARSNQSPCACTGGGRAFAEQFDLKTTFLPGFAQGSLFRVLVQFDMAAERQPLVQLTMVNQQDP